MPPLPGDAPLLKGLLPSEPGAASHLPASRMRPDMARPRTAACAVLPPGSQHPHHSGTQLEAYVRRSCSACQKTTAAVPGPSCLGCSPLGCCKLSGFGPGGAAWAAGSVSESNTGPARSRSCQQPDSWHHMRSSMARARSDAWRSKAAEVARSPSVAANSEMCRAVRYRSALRSAGIT